MTSQLFKPNLGLEPTPRAEANANEATQDTEKSPTEKVEELQMSPKVLALPLAESRTSLFLYFMEDTDSSR